jgi:lipoprotein-releasing system ATP-binding protein
MNPLMEVEALNKSFTTGGTVLNVLQEVSFSVGEGEFLTIIGQSGAGKSTLLYIMGALDRPDGGNIYFGGNKIFNSRATDLDHFRNKEVGFIFQFHHLMGDFTALENVMMPALVAKTERKRAADRASKLLDEVGLAERMEHRPGQLSGGELQRVAVARALIMFPRILLADEPTGNLDHQNSEAVFSLLKSISERRNLTVVMVTHNRDLASRSDRILNLHAGKVTEL